MTISDIKSLMEKAKIPGTYEDGDVLELASTAIAALSRVEELETILARHKELGIGENV